MIKQKFPPGWDEKRVSELLAELEERTDAEWIAADEAAAQSGEEQTVITIPTVLLPEVRKLIAKRRPA